VSEFIVFQLGFKRGTDAVTSCRSQTVPDWGGINSRCITNPFRLRTPEEKRESRHSQDAATQSQRAGELAGDAFDSAIAGDVPERELGEMNIEPIVELVSNDKSLAEQCLRVANSAMFTRRSELESIRQAVRALGGQRIRDIVCSCSLAKLFAGAPNGMAQSTLWRHAPGTS
jgi:hypothetical protein